MRRVVSLWRSARWDRAAAAGTLHPGCLRWLLAGQSLLLSLSARLTRLALPRFLRAPVRQQAWTGDVALDLPVVRVGLEECEDLRAVHETADVGERRGVVCLCLRLGQTTPLAEPFAELPEDPVINHSSRPGRCGSRFGVKTAILWQTEPSLDPIADIAKEIPAHAAPLTRTADRLGLSAMSRIGIRLRPCGLHAHAIISEG